MGPSSNGGGISIPANDVPMSTGTPVDEQGWSNGARSPSRTQNGDHPPRRSSRSRSPVRDGDRERERERGGGLVYAFRGVT